METIMTKQPPTLEERIDVALQPDAAVTSADFAALIEETETDIAEAEKERAVDQTESLNPRAARQAIMDATLAANRLRPLLPKLQAPTSRCASKSKQQLDWLNKKPAWLADYDVLKRERDALAEELREL
jgi:hypothetical protein